MKKQTSYVIIVLLLIIFAISAYINYKLIKEKEQTISLIVNNSIPIETYLESKCYSNLQPERFFMANPISNVVINSEEHSIKFILNNQNYNHLYDIGTAQASNTGSMKPTIPDYATIITIAIDSPNDVKIGDIIVIKSGDCKNVMHRIVKIDGYNYVTKGDNNAQVDNCITTFQDIKSKVVGVIW